VFEVQTAMSLDWRLKAGDIKGWDRQYAIEIIAPNGELIVRHKVDFRIHLNDDSYELLECKGFEMGCPVSCTSERVSVARRG
jgi:hypothetical protein